MYRTARRPAFRGFSIRLRSGARPDRRPRCGGFRRRRFRADPGSACLGLPDIEQGAALQEKVVGIDVSLEDDVRPGPIEVGDVGCAAPSTRTTTRRRRPAGSGPGPPSRPWRAGGRRSQVRKQADDQPAHDLEGDATWRDQCRQPIEVAVVRHHHCMHSGRPPRLRGPRRRPSSMPPNQFVSVNITNDEYRKEM